MTKWGLSATIKASAHEILGFAAYHLDQGVHRLYLYLDADTPLAYSHLKAHPKIRVTVCNADYWRKQTGKRPKKHQVRQSINATHAYTRRAEVDWLIHMDVDEFIWPEKDLIGVLDLLDSSVFCARTRPMESLSGDKNAFKAFIPSGPDRAAIVARLYPQFGPHVKGGFLSHLAGKLFVRTGAEGLSVKIHNVFLNGEMNPAETKLDSVALCHVHSKSWENWIGAYRFRLKHGSYRADLAPNVAPEMGGMTLHQLLSWIEEDAGEVGLRAFHDELCADTPHLRARLKTEGLLRICDLRLDNRIRKHFPDWHETVA